MFFLCFIWFVVILIILFVWFFYFLLLFICRLELFRNMYIFVIITKSLSNDMTHFKHSGDIICFSNYLTRCMCVSVCVILILLYQLKYTKFGKTLDLEIKKAQLKNIKFLQLLKFFKNLVS